MGYNPPPPPSRTPSPLEVARERYVHGKIEVEDFEEACDHWILGQQPIDLMRACQIYGAGLVATLWSPSFQQGLLSANQARELPPPVVSHDFRSSL